MKYLALIILSILAQISYAQNHLHGIVLDSLSNETILFAGIYMKGEIVASSSIDGKFQLERTDTAIMTLQIKASWYFPKEFIVKPSTDTLVFKLNPIPVDHPSNFIIRSKPIDTTYFENGNIQTIKYRGHDFEEFYSNGQIKYKSANGSTRTWYETGQLRSQSVLKNNHLRYETTWYKIGQKKSEGTVTWGNNEGKNEGEWLKNDDWKYWNKKGKEK